MLQKEFCNNGCRSITDLLLFPVMEKAYDWGESHSFEYCREKLCVCVCVAWSFLHKRGSDWSNTTHHTSNSTSQLSDPTALINFSYYYKHKIKKSELPPTYMYTYAIVIIYSRLFSYKLFCIVEYHTKLKTTKFNLKSDLPTLMLLL